jgi:hypothetical protein
VYAALKPTKCCLKEEEWEYNGGDKLVQGIQSACIELPQQNPLISLMYNKSKVKFRKITRAIRARGKAQTIY